MTVTIFSLPGIPEILAGDDIAETILQAAATQLQNGDILVITSKIVSKAEGRFVDADDREEAISRETVRVVATREHSGGVTRIVENRLGIISAAAGIDNSNVPSGVVLLLPEDPDASARSIREKIAKTLGVEVGIVISDTLGRPWREGQTDVAIGLSGLPSLVDLRGQSDSYGQRMSATVIALADEIAAAGDLVKGKAAGLPIAVVRGLGHLVSEQLDSGKDGAATLIRSRESDMFFLGTDEAWHAGYEAALADCQIRNREL